MAFFSRDRTVGESKRGMVSPVVAFSDLVSPFGEMGISFSDSELRETAYEIFVSACKTSGTSKPLTYIPPSEKVDKPSLSFSTSTSPSSSAASKLKKSPPKSKKPMNVGEFMRLQMKIPEQTDTRIRRALLRISAGQFGKRIESMVLPLEMLQQLKSSDFPYPQDYEAWQMKNLKILEAGLLLHPLLPLVKSDSTSQRLQQIISRAPGRPLETGKNSESMQILRSAVMSLSCRSFDGSFSDVCHWADGYPLNLRLYQMLLEACFDINEKTLIIEEVDEVLELIKKTWVILGITQMLHNLCFSWVLFHQFVTAGQVDRDLLFATDNQLAEVAKDAKMTKDPLYAKILSSTLSSILGWAEKRLLAYHDSFEGDNVDTMEGIVSLGVSAAKILVEDISQEYCRKRKEEVDVPCTRTDTYIRSSLRTAFAQRMEQVDSSSRSSKNQPNRLPVLVILAHDIGKLACKEKEIFSPILKRWHPFAAGVAVATLHSCYGSELKQFISGVRELTPDAIQVLKAADNLEKDLVQIAVEDSVDSDDGGKAIIREMPPYEAESAIGNLTKVWIKSRVDILKEWVDRNLQQEVWNPRANKERYAPSAVEVLRIIDETLEAFFQLPILMHSNLLPDLMIGLDRSVQHYISKAKSGCGTRTSYMPSMPALTRCTTGSKFHGVFKKKEKSASSQKRKSQVGSLTGDDSFGLPQLCVRMNTFCHIQSVLESLEKRIVSYLRNGESSHGDISNGQETKFEFSSAACQEGIQYLCEAMAYKVIFRDLSHVLWDGLYIGDAGASRIETLLRELEPNLETISDTVHNRVRIHAITALMKATFDGFLLVLLAGGPSRAFSRQDSQIIEVDFRSLKDLYIADGDGLPEELVEKVATPVTNVLPLLHADTDTLIERFKRLNLEAYGSAAKTKLPLPPTSDYWNPMEPNTILRVLCYRNDEAATKFLKKTYNLPKKL